MRIFSVVALCLLCLSIATDSPWSLVSTILEKGIDTGVYPGCVAVVGNTNGIVYAKAFGNYTYGIPPPFVPPGTSPSGSPPMGLLTLFDMASCTKVMATTSAVGLLYQQGLLDLDMLVCDPSLLGSAFAVNSKNTITVRNLLLHNAGYPPDPVPNYWDPAFNCPQTTQPHPAEDFSCRNQIYASLMNQTLVTPPNIQYVYSDISFITLAYVVGTVVMNNNLVQSSDLLPDCMAAGGVAVTQCYYEAYVRTTVIPMGGQAPGGGMTYTGFLPALNTWGDCAPAENDTSYQMKCMQGQVSDGNAYAMGGIAGHAGLFSNVIDIAKLVESLMFNPLPNWLTPETVKYFTTEYNHTQSSRALGWNTNDPDVFDEGWDLVCGDKLSPITFLHTGYTGTMICGDWENEFYTVLLTNRVYPTDAPGSDPVHAVRQAFGDAALAAIQELKAANGGATPAGTPIHEVAAVEEFKAAHPSFASVQRQQPHQSLHPLHNSSGIIPKRYPLFKQCDSRWGNDVMEVKTICQVGCLMSSVSMALNGFNISIDGIASDPATLNTWLQKNGGYVDGDDLEEGVIPKIAPALISYAGNFTWSTLPAHTTIPQWLNQGVVVIANVMNGGHFVLVTGYCTVNSTEWFVNDPGFNRQTYATSDIVGFRVFHFASDSLV